MESSRDSSVWRSLAVAFGDGLAFGVGMKLTQQAGRPSVAAPQTDLAPVAHRLERMEQRIAEIEQTPRTLAPPEKAALPAQPFDQKVLEAVVKALDARLNEHSSHVERQITELQAKVTIELQTLHHQDRSIADGLQALIEESQERFTSEMAAVRNAAEGDRQALQEHLSGLHRELAGLIASTTQARVEEVREQFAGQFAAIRNAAESDRQTWKEELSALRQEVAGLIASGTQARIGELQEQFTVQLAAVHHTAEADRLALREQVAALHHDVADILAGQYEALQQQVREEVHQSVGKMAAMAASAAESTMEARMAPLRAALEAKDREIAELRGRLAGSDQSTLDLLQGVGEICRQAAQRLFVPPAPPPETPASTVEPQAPAPVEAPGGSIDDSPPVAAAPAESDEAIPGFAQPKPPSRLWRVPLVSSLVLTSGVMLMRHFL
jgi:hypothetical protein